MLILFGGFSMAELPVKHVCLEGQEGTRVPGFSKEGGTAVAVAEDMIAGAADWRVAQWD
jgi:hypothetical protein